LDGPAINGGADSVGGVQEEEKRLKNEGRETLEETVQKLISKAGSHMESTLIGWQAFTSHLIVRPVCFFYS
jgi:hypothetical protein